MHIKRPKKFLILFIIPLIYLMCVILNITVFKGDRYTDMAASQRTLETDFKRNVITDRNMIPLTGEEIRYTDDSLARHIIGYTDAFGEGVSGIEKDLNDELSATEKKVRAKLKDAKGNEIPNFKTDDFETQTKKYVKLTLDYNIQNIVENVLDESSAIGAAVVLSTENFDVLAIASRPNFDQYDVAKHISSDGTALINRAETPYKADAIYSALPLLFEDVQITPLQAAEAICTVAAKGTRKQTNIVDGIALENGYIIKSMRKINQKRILPKATAKQLPNEIIGGVWATGYFPSDNPKYAVCVLVESGANASDIYKEIKTKILKLNIH